MPDEPTPPSRAVAASPDVSRADPSRGWRLRLFVDTHDEPRARRATDVIVLAGVLLALGLLGLVAVPASGVEAAVSRVLDALPDLLDVVWRALGRALVVVAVVLAIAATVRRQFALVRDMAAAGAAAAVLALLVGRVVTGDWLLGWTPTPGVWMPDTSVVVPAAALAVLLPHLTRAARRGARWLLAGGVVAPTMLGMVSPTQGLATLLVAVGASAAVHLALGSTRGRPSLRDVRSSLADLGIHVDHLSPAQRQRAGLYALEARGTDGTTLDLKVYGGDASDTEFLSMLWRGAWYRGVATIPRTRVQQVEHEALMTLLAAQAGVAVPRVVTVGVTPNDDAILVLEHHRVAQGPEGGGDRAGQALGDVWEMLARLHDAGIAHRRVDADHLVVLPDEVGLVDFRDAVVGAGPWEQAVDRVQALVAGCLAVGVEASVDAAVEALGHDEVASVVPFLQPAACTPAQRRALRDADLDLDDVREVVAEAVGAEMPELQRLRRVTWSSVVQVGLPVLAFLALATVVAGVDADDLRAALEGARGQYLAIAFVLAQLPRLTQSLSTAGASPVPIPLPRLLVLQLAQSYLALTVPSSAARVAMNVRFFQRHGLASGSALAVGALDSFFGFVGQMLALLVVLGLGSASLDLELDGASSGLVRTVLVVAAAALAAVAVVAAVPRLRAPVVAWVRTAVAEGADALRGLGSPRRLTLLLGGNLGSELLFALTLGALATALGYPLPLSQLVLIHVAVGLLAGVMPIPGGIGVVEGGITFGLASSGVPDETALAIAILFRAFTYYLPPLWGYVAFRWLTRNRFL